MVTFFFLALQIRARYRHDFTMPVTKFFKNENLGLSFLVLRPTFVSQGN